MAIKAHNRKVHQRDIFPVAIYVMDLNMLSRNPAHAACVSIPEH
jgi:hypothetical protein